MCRCDVRHGISACVAAAGCVLLFAAPAGAHPLAGGPVTGPQIAVLAAGLGLALAGWFMIARGGPRLSRPGYALLTAGLLAFLGGPDLIGSIADLRAGPRTTNIRLDVVSPVEGEVIASREIHVRLQLLQPSRAGWVSLTQLSSSTGHIHVALDGQVTSMAWSPSTVVPASPGRHEITVEFVAADHRPFSPRVLVARRITIQPQPAPGPAAGADRGAAVSYTGGPAPQGAPPGGTPATLGWGDWNWDPAILATLALSVAGYLAVARRFPPRRWQAACFSGGMLSLAAALVSPLDAGSEYLFTIHMVQHMLLLLVAAPLLALAVPGTFLGRLYGVPPLGRALRAVWSPLPAAVLFNGVIVFWHIPFAYDATLAVRWVHALEHVSFVAAGLVFWGVIVSPVPKLVRASWGVRLALVVAADLVNFLVGFALAFAGRPIYRHYVDVPRLWGLAPLDDLRLGGGVMWVMGQMMYVIPLLLLISVFLRREDTRRSHANTAVATPSGR